MTTSNTVIKLHNTKTRKKSEFSPIDAMNVRMYLCGPTVYDRAHLGNARPVVVFDVLYRLLGEVYGKEHVTYVRNFTDVDDKINATALARKEAGAPGTLEELVAERTEETIGWYLSDMGKLGALEPDHMPRATQYIDQMVTMIEDLIAKGHAYGDGSGHVLFSVKSYGNYGKLSGRSVDDMIAGARVEIADNKRDPMDFVLWKPSTDELPGWDSPWGRGRPGWHIECSAMSQELLGADFDIHAGGNDLMFPHHENEIAQSCCANGDDSFAKYWLHNEMLQVEGKKMSKSLGNFFTVHDLLDQDIPGEVIRFVFMQTHYRKPMDWTEKKAKEARQTLQRFYSVLMQPGLYLESGNRSAYLINSSFPADQEVIQALADDINSPKALARLHEMLKENGPDTGKFLVGSLVLLGLLNEDTDIDQLSRSAGASFASWEGNLGLYVERLEMARATAMKSKNFSEVDRLKAAYIDAGLEVRMSKAGVELVPGSGFDPAKLEALE